MTKWDYFFLGIKVCVGLVWLWTLLFAEVTLWPMKKPLHEHLILYPSFVILTAFFLIQSIWTMWGE